MQRREVIGVETRQRGVFQALVKLVIATDPLQSNDRTSEDRASAS